MNPEVAILIDKGRRSLAAAEELLTSGYPDFAASRAYYSMFYLVEAALLQRGLTFSRHSAVISAFGRYFVHEGSFPDRLHAALITAFDRRITGDYSYTASVSPKEAQAVIDDADEFILAVEAYLSIQED